MNLLFCARIISILCVVTFVLKIIFGNTPIHWLDWFSGLTFAIAVYFLEPPLRNLFRKKSFRRLSR